MIATLILADAAAVHPDGTFSLLRGGITQTNAPEGQVLQFRGAMMLRIEADPTEAGPHEFTVKVIDADGGDIAPNLTGSFEITHAGRVVNLAVNFQLVFPGPGDYEFTIMIDREQKATWRHTARVMPAS